MATYTSATYDTTWDILKARIKVTVENSTVDNAEATIKVQPQLMFTSNKLKFRQQKWTLYFYIDGKEYKKRYAGPEWSKYLPNDSAGAHVVEDGYLNMYANTWYDWGYAETFKIPNDGRNHTVGVVMTCDILAPSRCPKGTSRIEKSFTSTLSKYYNPQDPTGLQASYNPDTQEVTISWDALTSGSSLRLYINTHTTTSYDSNSIVDQGFVSPAPAHNSTSYVKKIDDESINYISFELVNVSANGNTRNPNNIDGGCVITRDSKVWVKVGNDWKKAIPWVKVNDVWKKANKVYVKVGNDWKRTIM